jgi:hypothetical protein
LLALPCSETVRFKLDQLIGTLHFNFNAAAAAQKQIRYYCKTTRSALILVMPLILEDNVIQIANKSISAEPQSQ